MLHSRQVVGFCIEQHCLHNSRLICHACIQDYSAFIDFKTCETLLNQQHQIDNDNIQQLKQSNQITLLKPIIMNHLDKLEIQCNQLIEHIAGNQQIHYILQKCINNPHQPIDQNLLEYLSNVIVDVFDTPSQVKQMMPMQESIGYQLGNKVTKILKSSCKYLEQSIITNDNELTKLNSDINKYKIDIVDIDDDDVIMDMGGSTIDNIELIIPTTTTTTTTTTKPPQQQTSIDPNFYQQIVSQHTKNMQTLFNPPNPPTKHNRPTQKPAMSISDEEDIPRPPNRLFLAIDYQEDHYAKESKKEAKYLKEQLKLTKKQRKKQQDHGLYQMHEQQFKNKPIMESNGSQTIVVLNSDVTQFAMNTAQFNIDIYRIHDGQQTALLQSLHGHEGFVNGLCFSRRSDLLASGSSDKTVKLWEQILGEYQLQRTLYGHKSQVNQVVFSYNDKLLASASDDKTIKIWNKDDDDVHTLVGHTAGVISVAFNADASLLVSGGYDCNVTLWSKYQDCRMNDVWTTMICLQGHTGPVNGISFNSDGTKFVSCGPEIILWNRGASKMQRLHWTYSNEHTRVINAVQFTTKLEQFMSCSSDGYVKLWNKGKYASMVSRDIHHSIKPIHSIAVSKDAKIVVCGIQHGYLILRDINIE